MIHAGRAAIYLQRRKGEPSLMAQGDLRRRGPRVAGVVDAASAGPATAEG